jgi:hypothetical protein
MSCGFSKETLALHVEHDLPRADADVAARHLATCGECREFAEQLRTRQSLLKSIRRETVSPAECTRMRSEVMSIINERPDDSGWALRLERAIVLGLRRRTYAIAGLAMIAIVSVSAVAQMRQPAPRPFQSAAIFEGVDTLKLPDGYRDWISATSTANQTVYISPSTYREYARTGRFPEGTLMIWESDRTSDGDTAHGGSASLLASVKDSTRFAGGWGFFDFTAREGTVAPKAKALPESSGCRTCHRQEARTDHVFTQFSPNLRS